MISLGIISHGGPMMILSAFLIAFAQDCRISNSVFLPTSDSAGPPAALANNRLSKFQETKEKPKWNFGHDESNITYGEVSPRTDACEEEGESKEP